ncbi:MAG: MarR family transcriptional regulator [Fibrobacter sp.]|nr:MarR family transcriptional regulator [Fibrobacter sp.]
MNNSDELLKLENQLCFPLYAASRLVTREYQPYLDRLNITYPQYLVLLILWEKDGLTVNEIAKKLLLNTNTVTPLLKRMEAVGILNRSTTTADERKVIVKLSRKGKKLKEDALCIPQQLIEEFMNGPVNSDDLLNLKAILQKMIVYLSEK